MLFIPIFCGMTNTCSTYVQAKAQVNSIVKFFKELNLGYHKIQLQWSYSILCSLKEGISIDADSGHVRYKINLKLSLFYKYKNLSTTCHFSKKEGTIDNGMKPFWRKYSVGLNQNLNPTFELNATERLC